MTKVVAVVGSNSKNSITYSLICKWMAHLSKVDTSIQAEIFCLRDYKIDTCVGCESCFHKGYCSLDAGDDMAFLRDKIEESDIIVFASPVYIHHISGIMMNFLNRMSSYTHTLDLAGKLGFTLTTTSSSGGQAVSNYLGTLQNQMGSKNLSNFVYIKLINIENEIIESWVNETITKLDYQLGYSDKRLERRFSLLKSNYMAIKNDSSYLPYECQFWQQTKIQKCKSFQEFAVNYRNFNKKIIK